MQDHLRPVDSPGAQPTEAPSANGTSRTRVTRVTKTDRALPTDRFKFEFQKLALKAIALESDNGKKPVGTQDIAKRLPLSPATAGLNNIFFTESGLITKEGKGRYKPTSAAIAFARVHGFDEDRAGRELAGVLSKSWYFREVKQQLAMGPQTEAQMIEVLAQAAGATVDRRTQLALLLDWLQYAGLVNVDNGFVKLADTTPADPPVNEPNGGKNGDEDEPEQPPKAPADPARQTATKEGDQPAPILSVSFDLALTAEDLSRLSPDQIKAVFEAMGTVMAIKK